MAMKRDTRVLFFTVGVVPTEAENDKAYGLTNNVGFRNSNQNVAGSVERAAAVAALDIETVPPNYREAYPFVESKADMEKLDKAIDKATKAGTPLPVGSPPALDNTPSGPAQGGWNPNA